MPFGARSSSCHMQSVAEAIVAMLGRRGIVAKMYLDDLIILSRSYHQAKSDLKVAQDLLAKLGLPEAVDKIQYPSQQIKWLGVDIDALNMTISIPNDRLIEVRGCVYRARKSRSLSQKQLQSLLGKLLNVAKCVLPARLFVARLLDSLRNMKGLHVRVDIEMKKDLDWFIEFMHSWNGTSIIPSNNYDREITVDACGSGVGGSDGINAYALQVAHQEDPARNIAELEGANVAIAAHTLISHKDRGRHILIRSDSMASVQVFKSGRGRNPVLLEAARLLWMVQALLDVRLSYSHVEGENNILAYSLSRLHTDPAYYSKAVAASQNGFLVPCIPNTFVLNVLFPSLVSRSGLPITPGKGWETSV